MVGARCVRDKRDVASLWLVGSDWLGVVSHSSLFSNNLGSPPSTCNPTGAKNAYDSTLFSRRWSSKRECSFKRAEERWQQQQRKATAVLREALSAMAEGRAT